MRFFGARLRRFVKTFSGRGRLNVLGALDFVTGKILTVTNDSDITAAQVCETLRKISAEYAGKTVRVILDNAGCQKCQAVWELALEPGIELLRILPYSPNLNLIERFRKFVKGELRSKYYDNFRPCLKNATPFSDFRGSPALFQVMTLTRSFSTLYNANSEEANADNDEMTWRRYYATGETAVDFRDGRFFREDS